MSEAAVYKIIDRAMAGANRAESDPDLDTGGSCQCCGMNDSIGVASVPGVPMSIAWCKSCIEEGVVPLWIAFAQATSALDGWPPDIEHNGLDRAMFGPWWLEWHDRTLARFGVTEEEFWAAVNEPAPGCGPTGDEMFCACGCGGDDSRCEIWTYFYRATEQQVPETHICCNISGRGDTHE